MKKICLFLSLMAVSLFAVAATANADTTVSPYPSWLPLIVTQAETLPTVGTVVKSVIAWAGTISGIATAASVFLMAFFGSLQGMLHSSGFSAFALKVEAFAAKVLPWVQYWSIFNVQVPPPAQASGAIAATPAATSSSPPTAGQ